MDPRAVHLSPACSCPPSSGCVCAAWAVSATFSPRAVVRAAEVGADGSAVNAYPRRVRLDSPAPGGPWAVHLGDAAGAFRLLGFDFDAHGPGRREGAAGDAARLAGLLQRLGIEHLVCASGPSGGRHVWVGLDHGAAPELVASLARLARHVMPTLDVAPLSNPATGCLRPPGSPHRDGGTSVVLAGDVGVLAQRSTTAGQVGALVGALAELVQATPTGPGQGVPDAGAGVVARDEHGHPHLSGPRRALPPTAAAAAQRVGEDASATVFSVLLGAARARWRHGDVAELAQSAPGLEHLRTMRAGDSGTRSARPAHGAHSAPAVLARQWAKAVATIAATAAPAGDDPTFDTRAGEVAALVRAVLERAGEVPQRWAGGGGPADRRVLEVLCGLAVQAVRAEVEADLRRIGRMGGFSHECARVALERLAAEGWITRVRPAAGRRAAVWAILPAAVSGGDVVVDLTQADPRPDPTPFSPTSSPTGPVPGVGAAERTALLSAITATVAAFAHDAFTHRALGLAAGNFYAATPSRSVPTAQMLQITGAPSPRAYVLLDRLASHGLLRSDGATWWRGEPTRRDAVAAHLDAHPRGAREKRVRELLPDLPEAAPHPAVAPIVGTLARRAVGHRLDQAAWAWWQAELAWRRAPRRTGDARRPGRGQLALVAEEGTHVYGPHPRRADGRADFRAARAILAAGHSATTTSPLAPDPGPVSIAA